MISKKTSKDLFKKKNVIGHSSKLFPKITNGKEILDTLCIRVYVTEKLPLSYFKGCNKDLVPTKIEGFPTDVVELHTLHAPPPIIVSKKLSKKKKDATEYKQSKHRPIEAGLSAINYQGTACTHGWYAKNKKEGEEEFIGIICNNHCGARENKATIGEKYMQPSPTDGGNVTTDYIGELWRYVTIDFGTDYTCPYRRLAMKLIPFNWFREVGTRVDVCLIRMDEGVEYLKSIYQIGLIKSKRDPIVGDICQKSGRTTCHTTDGLVIDDSAVVQVQYSRGVVVFSDVAIIAKQGFCAGGDSSSAVISKDNEFLGLLFAGSDITTIFCKTSNIEKELEVEILVSE